jgi:alpha-L-fucosidase
LEGIRPLLRQNDTSVSKNSWSHVQNQDYKTVGSLVGDLVDVVSKNGALLLNAGPRSDGTRPWQVFGRGPTPVSEGAFTDTRRAAFTGQDLRFTTKGDTLYAIALAWPGEQLTIKSLGTIEREIHSVCLLGHAGALDWSRDERGLMVKLPNQKPCEHAITFKID